MNTDILPPYYPLAAISSQSRGGAWQPIETAPKQGEWILVHGAPARTTAGMMVVRWDGGDWESADDGYGAYIRPTHWQPLPPAPEGAA